MLYISGQVVSVALWERAIFILKSILPQLRHEPSFLNRQTIPHPHPNTPIYQSTNKPIYYSFLAFFLNRQPTTKDPFYFFLARRELFDFKFELP